MKTLISAAPENENRVSAEQASLGSFALPPDGTVFQRLSRASLSSERRPCSSGQNSDLETGSL